MSADSWVKRSTLLNKLNTFPTIRRQVRACLKAGVMDNKQLFPTSVSEAGARTHATGTLQGGVISPLLANIALDGMENRIIQAFPTGKVKKNGKLVRFSTPNIIRYADDFVKTAMDIKSLVGSTHIKGQNTEEPDDTKVSRPVLKTSDFCEGIAWFNLTSGFVGEARGRLPDLSQRVSRRLSINPCWFSCPKPSSKASMILKKWQLLHIF
ncbi:reverse transcriptase domain-containing protein [Nostoc sp.]|uniref:reverse transcriptase domain-containing protein n=1 Tax=Nostoc sp. TaxID=1180 RepID=UPI003FA5A600